MKTKNFKKELKAVDKHYEEAATESIVTMLKIMGIKEDDFYEFPVNHGGHGIADTVLFLCYTGSAEQGIHCEVIFDTKYTCFEDSKANLFCCVQSRLRPIFRRYVKENPDVVGAKKYAGTVPDMASEHFAAVSRIAHKAGAAIISLLLSKGMKAGEYYSLPDVPKPRGHEDAVYKMCYYSGQSSVGGSTFELEGSDYYIGYFYHTYDQYVSNYSELNECQAINIYQRLVKALRTQEAGQKK